MHRPECQEEGQDGGIALTEPSLCSGVSMPEKRVDQKWRIVGAGQECRLIEEYRLLESYSDVMRCWVSEENAGGGQ